MRGDVIEKENEQRAGRSQPYIELRGKNQNKRCKPDHILRANTRRKNEKDDPGISERVEQGSFVQVPATPRDDKHRAND